MPLLPYLGIMPTVAADVEVHPDGFVIGKATIGAGGRIGMRAVVRADQATIRIGDRFSMGAESTVHVDPIYPTIIGDDVVVEERAVIHGCRIGDAVLVEREATVLSGSVIGAGSIIQADALVPEGREIPARSVVAGTPGRVMRETTDGEVAAIRALAAAGSGARSAP